MIVRNFLSIMFFCAFAISAMAQDIEWKTVDTEINSFEVPSDWRNSFHEEPGNEKTKRNSGTASNETAFEKENEICYKCVYDAKDMNGKSRSWTNIIYYREENNQVHRMEISTTTRNYKKIEGLEAAYMHMIKSLKVKEFDM